MFYYSLLEIAKLYDPFQVTVYHLLKLFQSETDIMLGKKSLVAEFYDEMVSVLRQFLLHAELKKSIQAILQKLYFSCAKLNEMFNCFNVSPAKISIMPASVAIFISYFQVFQDPTPTMHQFLTSSRPVAIGAYKHETDCMCTYFSGIHILAE